MPFADTSVYKLPDTLSDEQVLFLADILPTSFEVGVLNGMVSPGDVVAVVGAGPIGLAAILTATLYTPGRIVAIDLADSRLESATRFGADLTINNGREDAVAAVVELTHGLGADVAFEAVGVPQTFELATELIRPGGRVANRGPGPGRSRHFTGESRGADAPHPHRRPLDDRGRRVAGHPAIDGPRARPSWRAAGPADRPALALPPRPARGGHRAARRSGRVAAEPPRLTSRRAVLSVGPGCRRQHPSAQRGDQR